MKLLHKVADHILCYHTNSRYLIDCLSPFYFILSSVSILENTLIWACSFFFKPVLLNCPILFGTQLPLQLFHIQRGYVWFVDGTQFEFLTLIQIHSFLYLHTRNGPFLEIWALFAEDFGSNQHDVNSRVLNSSTHYTRTRSCPGLRTARALYRIHLQKRRCQRQANYPN